MYFADFLCRRSRPYPCFHQRTCSPAPPASPGAASVQECRIISINPDQSRYVARRQRRWSAVEIHVHVACQFGQRGHPQQIGQDGAEMPTYGANPRFGDLLDVISPIDRSERGPLLCLFLSCWPGLPPPQLARQPFPWPCFSRPKHPQTKGARQQRLGAPGLGRLRPLSSDVYRLSC